MTIINQTITLETESGINIHNIHPQIQEIVIASSIKNGQVIVFVRNTTTALAINEYKVRLLEDIKSYLQKLTPPTDKYLLNSFF